MKLRSLFLFLAVACVLPSSVMATNLYWTGKAVDGEGNPDPSWSNVNNWATGKLTGAVPAATPTSSDQVYFTVGAQSHTVYVDVDVTTGKWLSLGSTSDNINTWVFYSDPENPKTMKFILDQSDSYFDLTFRDVNLVTANGWYLKGAGDALTFENVDFTLNHSIAFQGSCGTSLYLRDSTVHYVSGIISGGPASGYEMVVENCTIEHTQAGNNAIYFGADGTDNVVIDGSTVTTVRTAAGQNANGAIVIRGKNVLVKDSTLTASAGGFSIIPPQCEAVITNSTFTATLNCYLGSNAAANTNKVFNLSIYDSSFTIGTPAASANLYVVGGQGSTYAKNSTFTFLETTAKPYMMIGNIGGDCTRRFIMEDCLVDMSSANESFIQALSAGKQMGVVEVRGKNPKFRVGYVQAGLGIDFVVPVGGYDSVPFYNLKTKKGYYFNAAGSNVRVLETSPALMVDAEPTTYPLMYNPYGTGTVKLSNTSVSTTAVPGVGSGWRTMSDTTFEDGTLDGAVWNANAANLTKVVAGLGAYIVGTDETKISVDSFANTGVSPETGLDFSFALAFGKTAEYADATVELREVGSSDVLGTELRHVTAAGETSVNFPASLITSGKTYEATLLVSCNNGKDLEPMTVQVEVNLDAPILVNVGVTANNGTSAAVGATLSHLGGTAETATAKLLVASSVDEAGALVDAEEFAFDGTIALNQTFAIAATGLTPDATYYAQVVLENDEGMTVSSDVISFVAAGATVADVENFSVTTKFRIFTVTGHISNFGAGTTVVRISYSTDNGANWTAVDSVAVTDAYFEKEIILPEELLGTKILFKCDVVNTFDEYVWTTAIQDPTQITLVDDLKYVWQAVDGDWSGDWTDAAHWSVDSAVRLDYPNSASAEIDFAAIPSGTPVTVTLPDETMKFSKAYLPSHFDFTFVGSGENSALAGPIGSFGGMTDASFTLNHLTWTASDALFSKSGYKFSVVNGANITLNGNNTFGATTYQDFVDVLVSNATLTATQVASYQGYTDSVRYVIYDGTVNMSVFTQNKGSSQPQFTFRGSHPVLLARSFGKNSQWNGMIFNFEIPENGYEQTPVQLNASPILSNVSASSSDTILNKIAVNVLPTSPVFGTNRSKLVQQLFQCVAKDVWFGTTKIGEETVDNSRMFALSELQKANRGNKLFFTYDQEDGLAAGERATGIAAEIYGSGGTILMFR